MGVKPLVSDENKWEKHLPGSKAFFPSTDSVEGHSGVAARALKMVKTFAWLTALAAIIFAVSMFFFLLASKEMFNKCRPKRIPLSAGNYWFQYEQRPLLTEDANGRNEEKSFPPYELHRISCVWEIQPVVPDARTSATKSRRSLVFFVHGNAGSYTDPSRLRCAMSREANFEVELYAFDFLHQVNIHRGKLIQQQAAFVAQTLESMLRRAALKRLTDYTVLQGAELLKNASTLAKQDGAISVWVVGHSMGGVVARLAVEMLRRSGSSVFIEGIITLNSPHRYPPIFLDDPMLRVYETLWRSQDRNAALNMSRHLSPRLYSVSSGALDLQVEPWLTNLIEPDHEPSSSTMLRTGDPNFCGRTLSHTEALRDQCVVEFITGIIANRSAGVVPTQTDATTMNPLVSIEDSVTLWWAQRSVKSHTLPAFLLSFYTVLVLSVIHPTVSRLMLNGSCSSASRTFGFSWGHHLVMLLRIFTMGGVVIAALLVSIIGHLVLVQLRCCLFPWSEMCSLPWVADDLACSTTTDWGHLPLLLIAWLGPALLGSWMGVVAYYLLRRWLQLSLRMWTVFRSICHSRFCFVCRFLPRRNMWRFFFCYCTLLQWWCVPFPWSSINATLCGLVLYYY
ncbi:GPI inositol deacylase 2 [Trypanosoma rangeli]|uniref:GPI inositol-deacylase n=1 Tax=Trypanosoma rangeli TaxID=5698 RepID=A0A3R7JWY6_TRYRA|nr:GPI inositol deacylase 2 [Trypanosoma rangeli]RNE98143.1 GPI inositol deacylase 2 [Trypanosoma rangeli]|eukprot:RNE98143.1 GPI inositol deacylase 2 [Trypanosoma rangeli]